MTEKTLSILGVIKKKLDSLDRQKKPKTVENSLDNEFDYVVPAKKTSQTDVASNTNNNPQDSSTPTPDASQAKQQTNEDKKNSSTEDKNSSNILANPELDLDKEESFKNSLNPANSTKDQYDFDIEDLIEEYEDQLSDEDLDGGSFATITYNLKIENKDAKNSNFETSLPNSKEDSDLEFDKINLNFSDELNSVEDKLFGGPKTNSNQTQISSPNKLLSRLTDQFKSKQSSESSENKTPTNPELNLDFDLKIDTAHNPLTTENSADKIEELKVVEQNNSATNKADNESKPQQNEVVKDEIDLEFEKQLLQLPNLDHAQPDTAINDSKNITTPTSSTKTNDQNLPHENDHFKLPSDSELSDLEIAEAKIFGNASHSSPVSDNSSKPQTNSNPLVIDQPKISAPEFSTPEFSTDHESVLNNPLGDKKEQIVNNYASENKEQIVNDDINLTLPQNNIEEAPKPVENKINEIKNNEFSAFEQVSQLPKNNSEESHKLDFDLSNFTASVSEKVSKTILNEDVIVKTNSSIQKLIETKNMMSGINNFMQSPFPAQIALQLMEPKLEKWLNENLPNLVEKIVSEEIKKIIPKEIK